MAPAIRALGWAGRFLSIITIAYLATSLYSFTNLMMGGGFALGEPALDFKAQELVISIPFSFNNTGFYDLTDANLTTLIRDQQGNILLRAETLMDSVPKGTRAETIHSISLDFTRILSGDLTRLLINDDKFSFNISIGLRYALALGFKLNLGGLSFPWGAPLSNFSLHPSDVSFNGTHYIQRVELSFENHSQFLPISGRMRVAVYNEMRQEVGNIWVDVIALPGTSFRQSVEMIVENPSLLTGTGQIHVYMESPLIKFGPVVIAYG